MKAESIRITLTRAELVEFYTHLGGRIGALVADAEILDYRVSEIAAEVASIRATQARIIEALQKWMKGKTSEPEHR